MFSCLTTFDFLFVHCLDVCIVPSFLMLFSCFRFLSLCLLLSSIISHFPFYASSRPHFCVSSSLYTFPCSVSHFLLFFTFLSICFLFFYFSSFSFRCIPISLLSSHFLLLPFLLFNLLYSFIISN